MNILIIYSNLGKNIKTITNHLYSFRRYGKKHNFFYLELSRAENFPNTLIDIPFDAVIFHYTFLALRFDPNNFDILYEKIAPKLRALQGTKVLLPQDEYIYTKYLWRIINDCNVKRIYTCMKSQDYSVLYPEQEIGVHKDLFRRVFTGYVDDKMLRWIKRRRIPYFKRSNDIVFRSTRSTYAFGMMGQQKTKMAEAFIAAVKKYPELKNDICLTLPNSYENTITGNAWLKFLLNSRTALGTLSGSSLFDPDGSIKAETQQYLKCNPSATDEDIEKYCYRGRDGLVTSYVLGPRHFECAMTKTCQILLEGQYDNMKPGVDYIEVKSDFSNIEDVLNQIHDKKYCCKIAEHCYDTFVKSNGLRYSDFVSYILTDLCQLTSTRKSSKIKLSPGEISCACAKKKKDPAISQNETKIKKIKTRNGTKIKKIKTWFNIMAARVRFKCSIWYQKFICFLYIIKHHGCIAKQRLKALKYKLIDLFYVSGRRLLIYLKPRHHILYKILYKLRCINKKRKSRSRLEKEDEDII